jgi:hypothetical protein
VGRELRRWCRRLRRVRYGPSVRFRDVAHLSVGAVHEPLIGELAPESCDVVSIDTGYTLTPGTSGEIQKNTATLTADRLVTLATKTAAEGDYFKITRSGSGAFNLSIGGLKNLATNTWCEVRYDGSAWYLAAYGAL